MRNKTSCVLLLLLLCAATPLMAAEAGSDGAEGPGPFDGAFGDALWTVIAFVVLLCVLWKFAWNPILNGLKARQEHIAGQISEAEKTRTDAEKLLAEYNDKLANAEHDGKNVIATHTAQAEQKSKEILQKASEELDAKKIKLELAIERSRSEAQAQLWIEAEQIILRLGREVFGKTLNQEDTQHLVNEAIERFKTEEESNI